MADGGSTDGTAELLAGDFATVRHLRCADCGRARQMNEAARSAGKDAGVFYFVHADTRPPRGFRADILRSIREGCPVGCYRFRFDARHPLLAINAFCTRFRGLACRGGDQSLFLTRAAWEELGGFRDMRIMEDYDIIQRIWARGLPFRVIPRDITVSARKYRTNGWLRVQLANWKVFRMYKAGAREEDMIALYRSRLRPW